jgi:hypothetical protein
MATGCGFFRTLGADSNLPPPYPSRTQRSGGARYYFLTCCETLRCTALSSHRLRFYDDQRLRPSCPEASQRNPEQPIPLTQSWARALALEHDQLLAQGNNLEYEVMPGAEQAGPPPEETESKSKHRGSLPLLVIADRKRLRGLCWVTRSLSLRPRLILATDRSTQETILTSCPASASGIGVVCRRALFQAY